MSRLVIGIGVDRSNKEIQIFDKYNIEHTEAYLEIFKELTRLLDNEALATYKVKLDDCTFEDLQAFASKNQEDLKKIMNKNKPRTKTTSTKKKEVDLDLENRFTYHKPKEEDVHKFATIRDMAKGYAVAIKQLCPTGREQSLALTKLEEVVMWANASIARGE